MKLIHQNKEYSKLITQFKKDSGVIKKYIEKLDTNVEYRLNTELSSGNKILLIKQQLLKENWVENIKILETNLLQILTNVEKEFDILFDDDLKILYRESKEIFKFYFNKFEEYAAQNIK